MAIFQQGMFTRDPRDTPETVARKRALAAQIMGENGVAPQNTWDGLGNAFASIMGGIAARNLYKQADAAAQAGQDSASAAWNPLLASFGGQQFPSAPGAPTASDYADTRVKSASGDSAESIKQGLVARGMSPQVADAFVMNFQDESGLNPGINEKAPLVAGSRGGYGLAQWTGPRRRALEAFAAQRGAPVSDTGTQLDFLMSELSGPEKSAWAKIQGANTTGGAAAAIVNNFLRPAESHRAARESRYLANNNPLQVASLDPSIASDLVQRPGMEAQAQPIPNSPASIAAVSPQDMVTPAGSVAPALPSPRVIQDMPVAAPQPMQTAQARPNAGPNNLPVMAGGSADAIQPGQQAGPSTQMLLQAASNPWLNDSQKAAVQMLLKQRLSGGEQNDFQQRASAASQYGLDPNSEEGRNFILTGKLPEQRGGAAELGLNPQYGVDEQGNPVLLQLGKDGKVVRSALPEGVHLSKEPIKVDLGTSWGLIDPITRQVIGNVPKDLAGASAEEAKGRAQGTLQASLPSDMLNTQQAISDIDALIKNPGLDSIVGGLDQYRPSWMLGDQGRDAAARLNQIKGKTFLQAYATLKGGGAITEVEGKKAEDAIGRLDRAQDEKTFRAALSDLRDVVAEGQRVMLQKAGIPADQWGQYLGGAQTGNASGQKRLKFNPATGELE